MAQHLPIPVVFVGHFQDPRSVYCLPAGDQTAAAARAACEARFVVDQVAWANGGPRDPVSSDWRDDETLPVPDVDVSAVVQKAVPGGVILNQTLISGGGYGLETYAPDIAATYPGLLPEPSLWAVTVLPPYPNVCNGEICLTIGYIISSVVVVIDADGRAFLPPTYKSDIHTQPIRPGDSGFPFRSGN